MVRKDPICIRTDALFPYTALFRSRGNDCVDVLVDYDPISGQTGVYKRIEVPTSLNIVNSNNKQVNRNTLDEGMEIIITYKYLDDSSPEKILIIG